MTKINPIIRQDYPDPDIIRVGDTYYLLSTTMHFFPGGSLLASHDLVNWEIINYLYTDALDSVPGESMLYEQNIYSHGMWAPTLRYHNGTFYALFISIASGRTFIFTATDPARAWKK
ncbi:MAG: family 43 glycosylhydrolase, partial [Lachnospiraceae bacterium]|nr:family 43 glycosylhydrolase [Lachnospiraceae bacterium]